MGWSEMGEQASMYERDRDVTDDYWMGVQDAATYLGIHRATLFRAVRCGMLVANYNTPKGRARFRQRTIDAFKETLKAQAAASHRRADTPIHVLAKLAELCSGLSAATNPKATIEEVIGFLCPPVGVFDMVAVAIRVPDLNDDFAVTMLAEQDFPERLKAAYQYLRPCEDFPATKAMKTGAPVICDDLGASPFPSATPMRVMEQNGVVSYAAFPIATGAGEARAVIGVLVVCGRQPYKFSKRDELFLGGVADALSACIMNSALRASIRQPDNDVTLDPGVALTIASNLLDTAYAHARRSRVAATEPPGIPLLCELFTQQSRALATWVDGFPHQMGDATCGGQGSAMIGQYRADLKALVAQTRAAQGLKRALWRGAESNVSRVTAVALPVPLPSGACGAVGAVWPGRRIDIVAEEILLSTLASACTVVSH